jgi:hypothetical protein
MRVIHILQASTAAPNPLSMFTTPTPGEQAFNIVKSGAKPANAAPYLHYLYPFQ